MVDFETVVDKVSGRVEPWQGKVLAIGGRLVLINDCLTNIPMIVMGFYLLSAGTHAGFDKHRGAFYWNAADNRRKYRFVKWNLMCRPKNLGG